MTRPLPSPVLLVLGAVLSVQFGGAVAVTLLPLIGVPASVALRLAISGALLLLIARPRVRGHTRRDWLAVVLFGLALTAMNTSFYASLTRLHIGVAVTIEFLGPLVLSAGLSRRPKDLGAVVLAAAGVVLISEVTHTQWRELDLLGIAFALLAGVFWAAYILLSGRVGARFPGLDGLAFALVVGTVVLGPVGIATAGSALLAPDVVLRGVVIAVMSSLLPYSLELLALRRMDADVFGILLSLEPAVAALAGLLVLHQTLTPWQLVGMTCVVLASVAVTRRGNGSEPPEAAELG